MTAAELTYRGLQEVQTQYRQVAEDLAEGRTVFWLLPHSAPLEDLVDAVCNQLNRWGMDVHEVNVRDGQLHEQAPASGLLAALDLKVEDPTAVLDAETLIQQPDWPDVVVVHGITGLPEKAQARWFRFAVNWARAAQGAEPQFDTRTLFFPLRGQILSLPPEEVRLIHRHHCFRASANEMQWLLRQLPGIAEEGKSWATAVYPELAGADLDLLLLLAEDAYLEEPELFGMLAGYGRQRGWSAGQLQSAQAERLLQVSTVDRMRRRERPRREFEALWAMGALGWTPEYGLELHAAAVALLERWDVLRQRVWRGQVRVLLPFLDSLRRDICQYLTRTMGPRWIDLAAAEHMGAVQMTEQGPLSEFGHLWSVVESGALTGRVGSELRDAIRLARRVRNQLAHFEPISRSQFESLLGLPQHLGQLR